MGATVWIADHYLRAVHLTPGEHLVEFRYDGPSVWQPRLAAGLGWLAMALLALGPALARRRTAAARPQASPSRTPADTEAGRSR